MTRIPRVVIASGNHLCSNPRVVKEADALSAAGFEVVVLGAKLNRVDSARDRQLLSNRPWCYEAAFDLTRAQLVTMRYRLQRRLGALAWQHGRLGNPWQLSSGGMSLVRRVKSLQPDLVIAHSEPALVAAIACLRSGGRAGVDMEDWFSEDLLPAARRLRPTAYISGMEARLLCAGSHITCTSEVMAEALVDRYGCQRPVVVRNVFPANERGSIDGCWKDRAHLVDCLEQNDPKVPRSAEMPVSIHWFSQTIGPGRGLEELFSACRLLRGPFEVHLRGESGRHTLWLKDVLSGLPQDRIRLHGPVENSELLSRIAEHDIGFAGELADPPSRDLTITNKFFQYLQGGLGVVASATAGQREGAACAPEAVALYQSGDVCGLAGLLQQLIDDRCQLAAMRAAAWEAGGRLCWENEVPKLVQSVERCLAVVRN